MIVALFSGFAGRELVTIGKMEVARGYRDTGKHDREAR